ncbi:uncharacterized protein LOC119188996 [Manduca sexta]|uniref:Uncharacterized protein n=1 Tax=Manduca sexta TaxID=7130 RepID=A0A921ZDJ6_MANSE|nr:uncharacterized protein LOC119188996 [Manduca sexta]KAG6455911.1 hypothetical protein O3G_MSEX009480 [Manduca sexta]
MGFQLPRVSRCCCCVPLRIGSMLIGYFSIIFSCLAMATVSWYIYKVVSYVEHNKLHPNPEHTQEEVEKKALSLYVSFAYYLSVFLYYFIISIVLVIGVHSNKPNLLRSYVKAAMFLFALAVALVVVTCVFMGFFATLPILKWCFTLLVCMVVVRSTYLEMEEQNKPRVYEMQNLYMTPNVPLMA